MSTPQRRSTDQALLARIRRVVHVRDFWMLAITALVFMALASSSREASRADRRSRQACQRAQINIPIQLKALTGAVQARLITQAQFDMYAAQRPRQCDS